MAYLLLIAGFIVLIKGADFFVSGGSSIAAILKIPPLIIGLTIISFGTSAPEAAISIAASLKQSAGMSIGNAVGSNMFNLLPVIGVSAVLSPILVKKSILIKDYPFSILSALVLFVLASDTFLGAEAKILSRSDGIILLIFFGIFLYYLIVDALSNKYQENAETKKLPFLLSVFYCIFGILCIIFGGQLVVSNASIIAKSFNMSDELIGLTVVAIGTSLPEFVTSVVAARKGESDIAVGNVIGSNIFNIFFVLGTSAAISPLAVDSKVYVSIIIFFAASLFCYMFIYTGHKITRTEGLLMTALYILYFGFTIIYGV